MSSIFIPYKPFLIAEKKHAIVKSTSDGKKHRYLCGVASGSNIDKTGEIVSEACIKSFNDQAESGNILLYADRHGVAYTQDIGILTHSEILKNGDWYVEFRLYDELDGVGQDTLDTINKLWKQINGLPPYKKPMQKGFSIEGHATADHIKINPLTKQKSYDFIKLIGAVVVPDPAYASVASAIYKSFDQTPPWVNDNVVNNFKKMLATNEIENAYYKYHYKYQDLLEEQIEFIMTSGSVIDKKTTLQILFSEYAALMIDLILQSSAMFEKRPSQAEDIRYLYETPVSKNVEVLKGLLSTADKLIKSLQ